MSGRSALTAHPESRFWVVLGTPSTPWETATSHEVRAFHLAITGDPEAALQEVAHACARVPNSEKAWALLEEYARDRERWDLVHQALAEQLRLARQANALTDHEVRTQRVGAPRTPEYFEGQLRKLLKEHTIDLAGEPTP